MRETIAGLPSSICFRVTRRCNAACSFCQAPPTSRVELSVPDISQMSRFFAAHGVRSIKLSGGEPTVRSDLPEIITAIATAGPRPVIITNGVRVSADTLRACAEFEGELKFSVHQPSFLNDEILRRRSFEAIKHNMAETVRHQIRLSINAIVTPESREVMAEMVDFACGVGAGKLSFIPVVARGRAKGKTEFSFLPDELDEVLRDVSELARLHGGRLSVRCINIRSHGYWIVENDGSLWVERATEETDVKVCEKELLTLSRQHA